MSSVGIIAKYWNEEVLLPHWLKWLNLIDARAIILADDGSTDASAKICEAYTHKSALVTNLSIDQQKREYFTETIPESQKVNDLLAQAYDFGCDWVLHLDIDEFPTLPMIQYINEELPRIPPNYGIYFPICNMYKSLDEFIIRDLITNHPYYPEPHLKIFGKESGFVRTINGMDLDQGVTGGNRYIMTSFPYIHLKYLFRFRRWMRYTSIENQTRQPMGNFATATFPKEIIPKEIREWWMEFKEPGHPW